MSTRKIAVVGLGAKLATIPAEWYHGIEEWDEFLAALPRASASQPTPAAGLFGLERTRAALASGNPNRPFSGAKPALTGIRRTVAALQLEASRR